MQQADVGVAHPNCDALNSSTLEAARRAAFLLGLTVVLCSSTVLSSGWWGDMAAILSLIPGAPTMKANTAFSLLLCGIATSVLASNPEDGAKRLTAVLAVAAALICALTVIQIATGLDFGIDQLLVEDRRSLYAPPGQMSAATAISGVMVAAVLLLTATRNAALQRLRTGLIAAGIVIAAMAIYIYVFEVQAILTVPFLSTMSLPTAACFLALFAAAAVLEPSRGIGAAFLADRPSSMIMRQLLLPIILLPLLVGVVVTALVDQPAVSMAVLAVANTAILCGITILVSKRIDDYDHRQRQMHARSIELMEQATAANAAKSRFLATMSHDLRTPLNAIIGFSEVMHGETLGPIEHPKYREYIGHIHSSGETLLDTINSLLDIARIEAGVIDLQEEPCDLYQIAQSVLVESKNAHDGQLILTNRISEHLPRLIADPTLLRRMISNVVANSIKFTSPGGEILLDALMNETGEICFVVQDNGAGFDPRQVDRLTEAFEQGSEEALVTKSGSGTGLGLGLAIVKNFATLHRARVWISSEVGRGTRVELVFPKDRIERAAP